MTFTNSILSGDTLVRRAIQSEGYQAGLAGWRIERDGDAFFESVTTRGSWRVQNAASGDAYIEGNISGNIPYIKWNGLVGLNPVSALAQMVGTSGIGRLRIHIEPLGSNAALSFADQLGIVFEGDSGSKAILFDKDTASFRVGTFAPWVEEGWLEVGAVGQPIFNNAWNNLDPVNWETLAYRQMPDGTVLLKGAVSRAAAAANDLQIFQLPVGYRPTRRRAFACGNLSAEVAGNKPTVRVYPNGAVTVWGLAGAAPSALALDGVQFSII